MRIEIAGAQITDAVVEVLDTLQNNTEFSKIYLQTLDELTRAVILDPPPLAASPAIVYGGTLLNMENLLFRAFSHPICEKAERKADFPRCSVSQWGAIGNG